MDRVEVDVQEIMRRYTLEIAGLLQRVVVAEASVDEWRKRALEMENKQPDTGG